MDLTPRFAHPNRRVDPDYNKTFNIVGQTGLRRIDGWEKTGRAMFGCDYIFPGTLYARLMSCPYAHASIKSMDTSKAEAYPGVRKVVRYDDASNPYIKALALPQSGLFEGEPMGAAVIADTDEIAIEAIRLIQVEWEVLPFALECADALKPDMPILVNSRTVVKVTDSKSNLITGPTSQQVGPVGIVLGDVQEGFKEADKTIEFTTYKAENHARVEPVYGSFWYHEDHLDYACSGQFQAGRFALIPTSARNVYQYPAFNAGQFGHGYCVIMMAGFVGGILSKIMMGTPVQVKFDINQANFYTMANDAGYDTLKIGFKNDGTITAVQSDSQHNNTTFEDSLTHWLENTRVPNLKSNYVGASVNRGQAFACRSEQRLCVASLNLSMAKVAAELGVPQHEIALKNDGATGEGTDFLDEIKKEQGFPDRDSLKECVDIAKEAIDFDNVWHKPGEKKLTDGRMHGLGFGWTHSWTDMTFFGNAAIILSAGKATILGNHADVGVNAASAYCQLVAEEIGVTYNDVYFKPNVEGQGLKLQSSASASNMCDNGWMLKDASKQIKSQILYMAVNGPEFDIYPTYQVPSLPTFAAAFPGKAAEELDIKDGYVFEKAKPENKVTVASITNYSAVYPIHAPLMAWGYYHAGNWGCESPHRERMVRQAHFVEVAVDTETGEIEVTKVVNVNDVGKAISPESINGQQYGGSIMGISRGKGEETIYDKSTGVRLNGNLLDYKISTIADCGPIDTHIVETALGYGPYGLVGVAEANADIMPCTLGPAIYNAIGVWIDDYPITPEKVLKALGKA
jgi:xanthine dehydrogenase molybdenum-binding subunit